MGEKTRRTREISDHQIKWVRKHGLEINQIRWERQQGKLGKSNQSNQMGETTRRTGGISDQSNQISEKTR
jgi:hypothetical protein